MASVARHNKLQTVLKRTYFMTDRRRVLPGTCVL